MFIWIGIKKELRLTQSTLMFHILALFIPLLFLFFWTGTLDQDITLPAAYEPESEGSWFLGYMSRQTNPAGTAYIKLSNRESPSDMTLDEAAQLNSFRIAEEPQASKQGVFGRIELILYNINANLTKNYRNRLTQSAVQFTEDYYLKGKSIQTEEIPLFGSDIQWTDYFSVTSLGLAVFFTSLIFGAMAFTSEWSAHCMGALALSPLGPFRILAGKLLAGFLKGGLSLLVYYGITLLVNPGLSPRYALLAFNIFLFYTFFFILGMILGLTLKEPIISFVASLVLSIGLWVLSGGFGTAILMTEWVQKLMSVLPSLYAFRMTEYAFFGGFRPSGALLIQILADCGIMIALWLIYRNRLAHLKEA